MASQQSYNFIKSLRVYNGSWLLLVNISLHSLEHEIPSTAAKILRAFCCFPARIH
jgi:hypothetical protein